MFGGPILSMSLKLNTVYEAISPVQKPQSPSSAKAPKGSEAPQAPAKGSEAPQPKLQPKALRGSSQAVYASEAP